MPQEGLSIVRLVVLAQEVDPVVADLFLILGTARACCHLFVADQAQEQPVFLVIVPHRLFFVPVDSLFLNLCSL